MYSEEILDHNAHPLHKNDGINGDIVKEFSNTSCGDKITIELKVKGNIVTAGSYTGVGCAISQASADMMIDAMIGKKLDEITQLREDFTVLIHDGKNNTKLGELNSFENISKMPARVKCALLPWQIIDEINH